MEALGELSHLAVNLGTEPLVVDRLRLEYEEQLRSRPRTVKTRTTSRRDGTISNTPHCASHCLPANARPLSDLERAPH